MRRIPREAVAWASGAIIAAGAGAAGVGYAVGAGHQAGTLRSFWTAGRANMLDKGAITGFEAGHGMPTDGVAGRAVCGRRC